jgi:hypothetical protein
MRFVRVKKAPAELKKDEYVIPAPSFLPEVKDCTKKCPRNGTMTINYLRELIARVAYVYAPADFDPMTTINVSYFKGTPCSTEEEANEILLRIFTQQYTPMLDAFVATRLKMRPSGTRLVYFLGTGLQLTSFLKLGFEEVLEKDLDKPKKTVGRPAITKEEAEKQKEELADK